MFAYSEEFRKYIIEEKTLSDDGYIGIPVNTVFLFDKEHFGFKSGTGGTPIIVYVINTLIERVGTLGDEQIVKGMLERGYAVCVFDYDRNPLAKRPALDFSVQKIRRALADGKLYEFDKDFSEGACPETLVAPAGYDVTYGLVYWEFDKHGADGTLDKIVEIWNNDFRGTKGGRLVKWTDENGKRKEVEPSSDGSLPLWYDKAGNEDPEGEYTKIKYAVARDINDCVKPDGSPIDFKLYMHIVYPTKPVAEVPVMCLSASSENLCNCSAQADRPHLVGFTFAGYAAVLFDYGYTPMARNDHYGYFDGFPKQGYVTGDNPTYSMKFYNDFSDNAAMRFIRYLTESEPERYSFDSESIGVYGNSKGSWMTFLGEKNPCAMTPRRVVKGHSGRTAYETGSLDIAEPQPWLSCNGKELASGAKLTYSSCGGTYFAVSRGHGPMFVSCNRMDSSCFSSSNAMVNLGRIYDIPTMWLEIPFPHTIVQGTDLFYGADAYGAFFDFCNYYLRADAIKTVGARVNKHIFPTSVTLLFSGTLINGQDAISLTDTNGNRVEGSVSSCYGGVEWTFTPSEPLFGEYIIKVSDEALGDNGKALECAYEKVIDFGTGSKIKLSEKTTIIDKTYDKTVIAFEVINDGINTVGAYDANGICLGSVNTSGKGWYKIDASLLKEIPADITLRQERPGGNIVSTHKLTPCECEGAERCMINGEVPALKIAGASVCTSFPTEEFYSYPARVAVCDGIIKDGVLEESDIGRRFKISFKIMDTASRYLSYTLNHCSHRDSAIADYYRVMGNELTKPDTLTEIVLDYTVYEPIYGEIGKHKKSLTFSLFGEGCEDTPVCISDVKCEEIVSDVELGRCYAVSYNDDGALPFGMSEIVCPKSPWEKK